MYLLHNFRFKYIVLLIFLLFQTFEQIVETCLSYWLAAFSFSQKMIFGLLIAKPILIVYLVALFSFYRFGFECILVGIAVFTNSKCFRGISTFSRCFHLVGADSASTSVKPFNKIYSSFEVCFLDVSGIVSNLYLTVYLIFFVFIPIG